VLPNDYRGYFDVARSYVEANKPDSALIYLQKSLALNPNDANIQKAIADVASATKKQ
jgi:predicted Zn-dependent protease